MDRRDFIKTGLCLGCAGILNPSFALEDNISNNDLNKFMIHSEKELPKRIRIDICNLCQLNCAKCWIRENEEIIKKENGGFGYVNFKTFKKFIKMNPYVEEIELSCNGEIFLNPDLNKIIKYAHRKNIKLTADNGTNLNKLSEKTAEYLVKYKFDNIRVSIDGASPETYAIYRRGGDFNKVINNIKMINKYKKIYNSEYPKLTYQFIVFGHNEHEIEAAKKLAKELNMRIVFKQNGFPEYSPIKNKELVYAQTGLVTENDPTANFYKNRQYWFYCNDINKCPQINWNGDFFGCCVLYKKSFKINVFKEGLLNTLNNEKILYAKKMLTDLSTKPRADIPCSTCFVYGFLLGHGYTIEI